MLNRSVYDCLVQTRETKIKTAMKLNRLAVAGAIASVAALSARADSISPTSFSDSIGVGGVTSVDKTVTVSAGRPSSSLVDVFFLSDTTGSMGSAIGSVQSSASSILSGTAGLGDVHFGVGEYKDGPDMGDPFIFKMDQDITGNTAAVQAGINSWSAGGGGDFPESAFYGLKQVADTASWRPGSRRILTWFGDAPSHDPAQGVSQADAISALTGKGVQVEAINLAGAGSGLDQGGQASAVVAATGGHLYNGIAGNNVAAQIQAAITTAFANYTTVSLDLSEVPAGLSALAIPGSYVGTFDRSVDRDFGFNLAFAGLAPGDYTFNVYGTVDGGRVATETDHIVVGEGVPDAGASLTLLGVGVAALAGIRRKLA